MDCSPPGSSVYWGFSWQESWSGLPCPLPGDLPNPGVEPKVGIPHCWQILCCLSHQRSPRILGCVAYLFSRGSSQPMNWTHVSCIAGKFFISWATREADITSGGRGTVWHGAKVQSSVSHNKTPQNYVLETKKPLSCPWFLNLIMFQGKVCLCFDWYWSLFSLHVLGLYINGII